MINDGGAERMVKNRKVEWWQILAIVIMMLFVVMVGLFFFAISNPDRIVDILNKATVGDSYEMLGEIKKNYPELAVTNYNQSKEELKIEFKYYEEIVEKNIDQLKYSYDVKTGAEEYYASHPDSYFVKNKSRITLEFPEVSYSNVSFDGDFEFSDRLDCVAYHYTEIGLESFLDRIGFLAEAREIEITADPGVNKAVSPDRLARLTEIKKLKSLRIAKELVSEDDKNELEAMCDKLGIVLSLI